MKENRAFRILLITKKQTGFAWNFLETPIKNVEVPQSPISTHPIPDILSF